MASILKKALKSERAQIAVGKTVGAMMRLFYFTARVRMEEDPAYTALHDANGSILYTFWHGRIFFMPLMARQRHPETTIAMLISGHRDGAIATAAVRSKLVNVVAGSSRRGGHTAAVVLAKILNQGNRAAVTPDGPKGPRMRFKVGTARLAVQTGAPVVPLAISTAWGKRFQSWDRFLLPYPFTKALGIIGAPVVPPKSDANDSEIETFRLACESALNNLQDQADRKMGRSLIKPAAPK